MNGYTKSSVSFQVHAEHKCAVVDIDRAMYEFILAKVDTFVEGDGYYDAYHYLPIDVNVMILYIALGDIFRGELNDNPLYIAWKGMIEALSEGGYDYALLRHSPEFASGEEILAP